MATSSTLTSLLESAAVAGMTLTRGIEKESLRVDNDGSLARDPHPAFLGSKLCHPQITTDFSEAQLELITPVHHQVKSMLADLDEVHRFVYQGLENQLLWAASMPCVLNRDNTIPLADYGPSNLGQLKKTYRRGLGLRYGRAMQTICAVHYNLSFTEAFLSHLQHLESDTSAPDTYRSRRYFDMMRNFRHYSWLLVYLFGASPAVCKSFVQGRPHSLEQFDEGTLYLEHATSLRNGNLGYSSGTQQGLINICYNGLANYTRTLAEAITTEHAQYQKIGLREGDRYLQVNTNILQSEAEFYTSIRAKRVPPPGVNFLHELLHKGVEYVEVRLLDLDPYEPLGVSEDQLHFLDVFVTHCLMTESPVHGEKLCQLVQDNLSSTVVRGREPGLKLNDGDKELTLKDWGRRLLDDMKETAAAMDNSTGSSQYTNALEKQFNKVEDADRTPSARILADMTRENIPFFRFAMNRSLNHKSQYENKTLTKERQQVFEEMTRQSIISQDEIDTRKEDSFALYLEKIEKSYLSLR